MEFDRFEKKEPENDEGNESWKLNLKGLSAAKITFQAQRQKPDNAGDIIMFIFDEDQSILRFYDSLRMLSRLFNNYLPLFVYFVAFR